MDKRDTPTPPPPEETIDPGRPIVDAHHHLWMRPGDPYALDQFLADVGSAHNIRATVFVTARSMYRQDGPEELKPVGETEFANGIAAMSASGAFGPTRVAAAIIGSADLMLGDRVEPVLQAHMARAGTRFRGVRYMLISDRDPEVAYPGYAVPPGRAAEPSFRASVRTLGRLGLSFDAIVFHTQLEDVIALADACPDTTIILNHLGLPVRIASYASKRDEVTDLWATGMRRLAERRNVLVKIGGLGLHWFDFGFQHSNNPSSVQLANAWKTEVDRCIETFKPSRCMFESNFPVDKASMSYTTLWNAFKRLSASYSEVEKMDLFGRTACQAYRLQLSEFI